MRPTNESRMWGAMDNLLDTLRAVTMRRDVDALLTSGERARIAKYQRDYSRALERCNREREQRRLTPGASSRISPAMQHAADSRGKSDKRAKTGG